MEFFQAGCWDLFTGYFKFGGIYVDKIHVKDTSEVLYTENLMFRYRVLSSSDLTGCFSIIFFPRTFPEFAHTTIENK